MNQYVYADFLQNILPGLLAQKLTEQERNNLIFQQDNAPAHTARTSREVLGEMFPRRYLGLGGLFPWPARSPDMNPLDFYLWSKMKNILYHNGGNFAGQGDACRAQIFEIAGAIPADEIRAATVREVEKRVRKCIERRGGHFEQFMH